MSGSDRNGYLLLSHTDVWDKHLSQGELQKLIADNRAWIGRLIAAGKAQPGVALVRDGATGCGSERVILDGPFVESKEAIGGPLILDVATLDEASAIAKAFPGLGHDSALEIRPMSICPMSDACPLETWAQEKENQLASAPI